MRVSDGNDILLLANFKHTNVFILSTMFNDRTT